MSIVLALFVLFYVAEVCGAAMLMYIGGLGILFAVLMILSVIFHGTIAFLALYAGTERKVKEEKKV